MSDKDKYMQIHKDVHTVLSSFDKNNDGKLDDEEVAEMKRVYAEHATKLHEHEHDGKLTAALKVLQMRYDTDGDGTLEAEELHALHNDIKSTDTVLRYLGYASTTALAAKYGRVALGPVVSKNVIRSTFFVSWGYVAGDVLYEAYKDHHDHHLHGAALYRNMVSRFFFQGMASVVMPYATLRLTVGTARKVLASTPMAKFGPPCLGLCLLPVMPFIWDKPVTFATGVVFDNLWPKKAES
eukprot:PhM_4_TR1225/c0_g1_i1/m.24327/K17981/MTFP1, MTP18; mitochondrial fission process protein 1